MTTNVLAWIVDGKAIAAAKGSMQLPQYDNISHNTNTNEWSVNGVKVKPGEPNETLERLAHTREKGSAMLRACLNYWEQL